MMTGVGYRRELGSWIASRPAGVECMEITAEHFFENGEPLLAELARDYPLFVHGLGLSLGTPGPLDAARLEKFARVAELAQARWVSEHIAFTRTAEGDLGHLNPVRPTREMAALIAAHAREVAVHCGRPIILENITSHLQLRGDLGETDFLNTICDLADCGLLLDVTNLYINSRNHGYDPSAWLGRIERGRIAQLHIVGYTCKGGRWSDGHGEPVQPELLDLAHEALAHSPVEAVILERDDNFPGAAAMESELHKLATLRTPR
jgi:uncharacterized protein (UPF0276 family)